jgi:hypothetical protein
MQHAVDTAKRWRESSDPTERQRGEKQFAQFGKTVDDWLQRGWHVVRIPLSEFTERGYAFDEPDAHGHLNAFGEHSIHAIDLAMAAEEVPPEAFHA